MNSIVLHCLYVELLHVLFMCVLYLYIIGFISKPSSSKKTLRIWAKSKSPNQDSIKKKTVYIYSSYNFLYFKINRNNPGWFNTMLSFLRYDDWILKNCAPISLRDFIKWLFKPFSNGVDVRYFARTCASLPIVPSCEKSLLKQYIYEVSIWSRRYNYGTVWPV